MARYKTPEFGLRYMIGTAPSYVRLKPCSGLLLSQLFSFPNSEIKLRIPIYIKTAKVCFHIDIIPARYGTGFLVKLSD